MKRRLPWFAAGLFLAASLGTAVGLLRGARSEPEFLLGGIQVNEPDHGRWVRELAAAGMNTVSVTVYAHQGDWDSDHLWFDDEAPSVLAEIRTAKAAGLEVVLILRVALDHAFEANRFLWHGMIQPRTDEQVRSWFRQYSVFAERWARLAEREGVDLLGIASEMNELTSTRPLAELPPLAAYYLDDTKQQELRRRLLAEADGIDSRHLHGAGAAGVADLAAFLDARQRTYRRWAERLAGGDRAVARLNARRRLLEQQWVELIGRLRRLYSGRMTYAANFDQYEQVGFWSHLDVVGINAYFPLRRRWGPERGPAFPALLEAGWRQVLARVAELRRRDGLGAMPVVFTELGYTSRRGCTLEPWAGGGFSVVDEGRWNAAESRPRLVIWEESPADPRERALAVAALRRAAEEVAPGMLQGVLYWKLSTLPEHRKIEPFVLVLGEERPDPLIEELLQLAAGFRLAG